MAHYHDENDLQLLTWQSSLRRSSRRGSLWTRLWRERTAIFPASSVSSSRLQSLIRTQCVYCIEVHAKSAKKAGATREEVAETALLAAALRAGGPAAHGTLALKCFDQA